jgi:heme exporter protein A
MHAAAKAVVVRKSLGGNPVPVRFRPQADQGHQLRVTNLRKAAPQGAEQDCGYGANPMNLRDSRAVPANHLEAENLQLWRGDHHVLKGVGFTLSRGECLQVTGSNGAGKTTLLRTLCGLMVPEEGRVLWEGRDVRTDLPAFHSALMYLGHEAPLKADLTARENLYYWIGVRRRTPGSGLDAALARVGADACRERLVRTLSAGQKRRVALAGLALMFCPLWLLDEPTTNLDAEGQQLVGALMAEQLARGGAIVVATHQQLPAAVRAARRLEMAA